MVATSTAQALAPGYYSRPEECYCVSMTTTTLSQLMQSSGTRPYKLVWPGYEATLIAHGLQPSRSLWRKLWILPTPINWHLHGIFSIAHVMSWTRSSQNYKRRAWGRCQLYLASSSLTPPTCKKEDLVELIMGLTSQGRNCTSSW
jgi:hypothetical protein